MKKVIWCSGPISGTSAYYGSASVISCFEFSNPRDYIYSSFRIREEAHRNGEAPNYVLYANKRCQYRVMGARLGFIYVQEKNISEFNKFNFEIEVVRPAVTIKLFDAPLDDDLEWDHFKNKSKQMNQFIRDSRLGPMLNELMVDEVKNEYFELAPPRWDKNRDDKVPDLFAAVERGRGEMNPLNPEAIAYIRKLFKKHGDELLLKGCVHVYGLGYMCAPELWSMVTELSNGSMPKICNYHDLEI